MAKPLQFTQAERMSLLALLEYCLADYGECGRAPGEKFIGLRFGMNDNTPTSVRVISKEAAESGLEKLKEADRG